MNAQGQASAATPANSRGTCCSTRAWRPAEHCVRRIVPTGCSPAVSRPFGNAHPLAREHLPDGVKAEDADERIDHDGKARGDETLPEKLVERAEAEQEVRKLPLLIGVGRDVGLRLPPRTYFRRLHPDRLHLRRSFPRLRCCGWPCRTHTSRCPECSPDQLERHPRARLLRQLSDRHGAVLDRHRRVDVGIVVEGIFVAVARMVEASS